MTARASLEAQLHMHLSRYKDNIADGMWRVTADNRLIDAILKAADRYAEGAATAAVTHHEQRRRQQREATVRPLIDAIRNAR